MEFLGLYLIDLLTSAESLAIIFCLIVLILAGTLIFYSMDNSGMFSRPESYTEELFIFKKLKKSLIICTVIFGILCVLPSKNTALIMFTVHYCKTSIHKIVTPEKMDKINKIIDNRLDKLLGE